MTMVRRVDSVNGKRHRIDSKASFQRCANYITENDYYYEAGQDFEECRNRITSSQYERLSDEDKRRYVHVEKTRPDLIATTFGANVNDFVRDCLDDNERRGYGLERNLKRIAEHTILSFHPYDNVSPEKALEIGLKFAEECFADFKSLVSVHIDHENKGTIHVHILTNGVSCGNVFKDSNGNFVVNKPHKFHDGNKGGKRAGGCTMTQSKKVYERLARENNLHFSLMTKSEIRAYEKQQKAEPLRELLRNNRIDEVKKIYRQYAKECSLKAKTLDEFRTLMREKGVVVEINKSKKSMDFRPVQSKEERLTEKFVRITSKNLDRNGDGNYLHQYGWDEINEQIFKNMEQTVAKTFSDYRKTTPPERDKMIANSQNDDVRKSGAYFQKLQKDYDILKDMRKFVQDNTIKANRKELEKQIKQIDEIRRTVKYERNNTREDRTR